MNTVVMIVFTLFCYILCAVATFWIMSHLFAISEMKMTERNSARETNLHYCPTWRELRSIAFCLSFCEQIELYLLVSSFFICGHECFISLIKGFKMTNTKVESLYI